MIRNKRENRGPIIIDLTGPDGNSFTLMNYAKRFAKQMGIESAPILKEMMSGDYENLIEVFDRKFGDFVILER
jgi:hypothetical protein